MSSNPKSSLIYLPLISLVVIASAAALAAAFPAAQAASKAESARLTADAAHLNTAQAQSFYHLAILLDSTNTQAFMGQARLQLATGQPEAAVVSLNRAGQGIDVQRLSVRTLMELGRNNEAADHASALTGKSHTDADIILTTLAYAQAGRLSDIPNLIPLVGSPEAAQHISRSQSSSLPLAAELAASGLPESSRRLLMKMVTSFERNILLAQIYFARHTPADDKKASEFLEVAVALNPADAPAHRLLADIYSVRGLTAQSSAQDILASKLEAGRP